ncbi:dTDP-4-dehydrorhamnose reductase [Agarivorans sp. B2Z047]|uniref:dTDP-4-dehydrorhamnose reductase n=1 Tax=Agarivorans sp. B2Z047 TaxID=2652721 RepID=UPI00128D9224|nr:dTDP-4-dehydrorhamnose reductase [Agarivorans sp. B2Z047]MPW28745.1 dTDP-4-dehydrorhamnose reductase [Agarivorans sp. B2Z047]UQN41306.1 dTDP-4-dehydrorhamnose reductase [Agarivorans sp. B2Z047]
MKVLVTGKGGQLAWELEQTKPEGVELVSLGLENLDITQLAAVQSAVSLHKPDIVINAAAYTAVDNAETDKSTAYAVNELGAKYVAQACKQQGVYLMHVSTDFVFSGDKTTPYQVDDQTKPINVYGESKLAGDIAVNDVLGEQALIVRTAWVYSVNGNNFVKTMLRLMADKSELGIIYDQVGTPTWAKGLALWLWAMAAKQASNSMAVDPQWQGQTPIYHWTDAGVASWYDFAVAIQELAIEKGLLDKAIPIKPIAASAYPLPAARPSFSVIDKQSAEQASDLGTEHWRVQLSSMMDAYKNSV